jgi:hypothetical protein
LGNEVVLDLLNAGADAEKRKKKRKQNMKMNKEKKAVKMSGKKKTLPFNVEIKMNVKKSIEANTK